MSIRWEDDVFGRVTVKDWIDVGAVSPVRAEDPTDAIIGDLKTDNLIAQWESIASEYAIPVMAQFHGFDTESQSTFRVPVDVHNIEKGLIKVKLNQSERLRALTNRGVVGNEALYDYVLNDGIRLADQVITRTKVAKNELLATGKITIKENNLNLTVDYGVPTEQTTHTINAGYNVDVLAQIQAVVDAATNAGVTITGMFTSRAVLSKLRKNEIVQKAINGNIGTGALVRRTALEEFMNEEFGISQIITNDLKYGVSATGANDGKVHVKQARYYPDNKITFFATNQNGRIGTGLWGDPPEVDMNQFYPVGGSEISPYVFITQKMDWDPAVLWTKASALFMPVLYNPNSLFIAAVTDVPNA